ncbi:MAG: DUF692 domain-containing protein [Steroidobacteraceae bacterium]|jgi:uncharacterized protein (UPF0276 family)
MLPTAYQSSPIPAAAGIGLRFAHHEVVSATRPAVPWFEVHAENYFGYGKVRHILESVRRDYPLSLHGVGLSLGSADGLDRQHLERLAALARAIEPGLISEHLSWSVTGAQYLADLLPLPMTEEALDVVCAHVQQVQEALQRTILIENPSTYLQLAHSTLPEWVFLRELAARTGCGILCDLNNIFVSASNHGWDPQQYLAALPCAAIGEFHLAGHAVRALDDGSLVRIDDHGSRVAPAVWALYEQALERFGPRPTLIEWDTAIPEFEVLLDEAASAARRLHTRGSASHACAA